MMRAPRTACMAPSEAGSVEQQQQRQRQQQRQQQRHRQAHLWATNLGSRTWLGSCGTASCGVETSGQRELRPNHITCSCRVHKKNRNAGTRLPLRCPPAAAHHANLAKCAPAAGGCAAKLIRK